MWASLVVLTSVLLVSISRVPAQAPRPNIVLINADDLGFGDLTASIVVTGAVDPGKPGTYELTYTVKDLHGSIAEATRTVRVETVPSVTAGDLDGETRPSAIGQGPPRIPALRYLPGTRFERKRRRRPWWSQEEGRQRHSVSSCHPETPQR